jgi:hypothetical protein
MIGCTLFQHRDTVEKHIKKIDITKFGIHLLENLNRAITKSTFFPTKVVPVDIAFPTLFLILLSKMTSVQFTVGKLDAGMVINK